MTVSTSVTLVSTIRPDPRNPGDVGGNQAVFTPEAQAGPDVTIPDDEIVEAAGQVEP